MTSAADVEFEELNQLCSQVSGELGFERLWLSNGATVLTRHRANVPCLSLLAGVHGNERSGPQFILKLLQSWRSAEHSVLRRGSIRERNALPPFGFVIVPCLNDLGWARNQRRWSRKDLNDHFGPRDQSPAGELARLYQSLPVPAAHLDLHEDSTTPYPYVWLDQAGRRDDVRNRWLAKKLGVKIALMRQPDKSSTHFMRRLGCPWTITTLPDRSQPGRSNPTQFFLKTAVLSNAVMPAGWLCRPRCKR